MFLDRLSRCLPGLFLGSTVTWRTVWLVWRADRNSNLCQSEHGAKQQDGQFHGHLLFSLDKNAPQGVSESIEQRKCWATCPHGRRLPGRGCSPFAPLLCL